MMTDEISIMISGLGEYRVTALQFDQALTHYLPASPFDLRRKINTHPNNSHEAGIDHLMLRSELLMVLAWLDSRPND